MTSETPVPVTTGSAFQKGKYFIIEPSFWGGGKIPGLEIANEDRLRLPGTYIIEQPNGDPDMYPESAASGACAEAGRAAARLRTVGQPMDRFRRAEARVRIR